MQKTISSFSHAVFFIKQYGRRYGTTKFFRALFHYFYRAINSSKISSNASVVKVNGYNISLIPNDQGISKELLMFKTHEPISTELISNLLQPGMICLDIGANIGYYVLLESKIIGKEGKIYAIEPSPENYNCLKRSLELENIQNVDAYNFAAGNNDGRIRFFVNERSNGCKVLQEGQEPPPNKPGKIIQVPLKKIDKFVEEKNLEKIDFLRMDVEGFELQIFEGMQKTLRKFKPTIQLEVHKKHMGMDKTKLFLELLKNHGYQAKFYHPRDLDVPFIGTKNDVKKYSLNKIIEMLEQNKLPSYFNLVLQHE